MYPPFPHNSSSFSTPHLTLTHHSSVLRSLPCTRHSLLSFVYFYFLYFLSSTRYPLSFTLYPSNLYHLPCTLYRIPSVLTRYERPILLSREPHATKGEISEATRLQKDLSTIVNEFILKRGNTLNAQHLPPKLVRLTSMRLQDLHEYVCMYMRVYFITFRTLVLNCY